MLLHFPMCLLVLLSDVVNRFLIHLCLCCSCICNLLSFVDSWRSWSRPAHLTGSDEILSPGTAPRWKVPQCSRWLSCVCHLHHKPAASLSFTNSHTCARQQPDRATYSSTSVISWCFLYHMCQWAGLFLFLFLMQPVNVKQRSVCEPCVGPRATLTTFTHTQPEQRLNVTLQL